MFLSAHWIRVPDPSMFSFQPAWRVGIYFRQCFTLKKTLRPGRMTSFSQSKWTQLSEQARDCIWCLKLVLWCTLCRSFSFAHKTCDPKFCAFKFCPSQTWTGSIFFFFWLGIICHALPTLLLLLFEFKLFFLIIIAGFKFCHFLYLAGYSDC